MSDAALGELMGSGLIWKFLRLWLPVGSVLLLACVRGVLVVVKVVISWLVALWLLVLCFHALFKLTGGLHLILLSVLYGRWSCRVTQSVQRTLLLVACCGEE